MDQSFNVERLLVPPQMNCLPLKTSMPTLWQKTVEKMQFVLHQELASQMDFARLPVGRRGKTFALRFLLWGHSQNVSTQHINLDPVRVSSTTY